MPAFSVLDALAWAELLVLWPLWAYGFFLQSRHKRGEEHAVTAPAAKWGIGLQAVAFFLASVRTAAPTPPRLIAALILGLSSAVFARQAVRRLGKQWRIQAGLYADHELVRTGPYAFVRHPIYASMFGMFFMDGLLMAWWPILIAAAAIFLAGTEIRVRAEDALLAARFGEAFKQYQVSTPAYIPFLR